jgi:hypothetical protein
MLLRAAFAERMINAAKAAARRRVRAGLLAGISAASAFFAVGLAVVAGVIALSEVVSPALAAGAFGLAFLLIAGGTAALARRAAKQVTKPVAATAPPQEPPAFSLSPQTIEVLVACSVAVILGVMAGRANRAAPKSPEE